MFTKKQIENYHETQKWFKDHMKDSPASNTTGLRFNGEKVLPRLMKIVDGNHERFVMVLGTANIHESDSVIVQTSITTEKESINRYLDFDVEAEVETVRKK